MTALTTDTPSDADIQHAAFGRFRATEEATCSRVVEALAHEFPLWAGDRAYAEYRVGVELFGWDWEGFRGEQR